MKWVMLIALVCTSGSVLADQASDDAYQRLQERQRVAAAERAQIVSITKGELDDLRAEIARLRAQLADVQAKVAKSPPSPNAPLKPGLMKPDAREAAAVRANVYTVSEAAAVSQHIANEHPSDEVIDSLWHRRAFLGMTEEEVRMIDPNLRVQEESAGGKVALLFYGDRVTIIDGKVADIVHRVRQGEAKNVDPRYVSPK